MKQHVAVLGASTNPDRYSYKAVKALAGAGYPVFPVHPSGKPIDGIDCNTSLASVPVQLDTITVYLSEKNSTPLIDDIITTGARCVILNPGAESAELKRRCELAGMRVIEACTLVLVSTGQFENHTSQAA